jgi:signal recognition particle subunit SRP19
MSHARIEEVSDSDPDYASDPSEEDIEEFDEREIIKARAPKPAAQASKATPNPSLIQPSSVPSVARDVVAFQSATDESKYKDYQCIYPIYFDRNRTRKEGRRVGIEGAVENPLAREIVAACGRLRLEVLFEPTRMHPKDWANPGRVKVKLKNGQNPAIKNSMPLSPVVCEWIFMLTIYSFNRASFIYPYIETSPSESHNG